MNNDTLIRKLPTNSQGKDYIVGDLHGCFSLLELLLEAVQFDKSRDRLFSVGDLIDRGPDSLRCLQLLEEPWFFAVRGNHETMMMEFFLPYLINGSLDQIEDVNGIGFLDYGGNWVRAYYQADQQCMSAEFDRGLALIREMPLIYSVGEGANRFHVIHAELISTNYESLEKVAWFDSDIDRWYIEQSVPSEVEQSLLWGRTLMLKRLNSPKVRRGLSTTFCGHTYATSPSQLLSHLCIDTGAYVSLNLDEYNDDDEDCFEFGLTLFDVQNSRWVSASYQREELIWGHYSA